MKFFLGGGFFSFPGGVGWVFVLCLCAAIGEAGDVDVFALCALIHRDSEGVSV